MPPRRTLALLALLPLAAFLLVGVRSYVVPDRQEVSARQPVDAVVALGGLWQTARTASRLVEAGAAPVLVLSDPYDKHATAGVRLARLCASSRPGRQVICFRPDPSTTRGEAQAIRALAARHGWQRVAVVAPTYHISRARMIVRRCYSGDLLMVDAHVYISPPMWAYHFVYQSAGYVKAIAFQSGC
jgi:uncharacterized SAM-binding protein YcdF (DUF218 family)